MQAKCAQEAKILRTFLCTCILCLVREKERVKKNAFEKKSAEKEKSLSKSPSQSCNTHGFVFQRMLPAEKKGLQALVLAIAEVQATHDLYDGQHHL